MVSDLPGVRGGRRPHRAGTAALAAGALAVVALAGCGGGGNEKSSAGSRSPAGTSSTASATTHTSVTSRSTTSTGTGGEGEAKGAHTTTRQAVDAVLLSIDQSKTCSRRYVTRHYLQVAYGGLAGCATAPTPPHAARSLRSYHERMSAGHASVTTRPVGGIYDGEKITVSLVKEGGDWKVDALKSNAPVGP